MSQETVAKGARVSQKTVSRIEAGENVRTARDAGAVARLANTVGGSALEAFAVAGLLASNPEDAEALDVAVEYLHMSDAGRREVQETLKKWRK